MMDLSSGDVNTTWLFRNHQFELSDLVAVLKGSDKPLAVASVGSSTGEEAYTLVAMLDKVGIPGKVTGYDRIPAAVNRAKEPNMPSNTILNAYDKELKHLNEKEQKKFIEVVSSYFDHDFDQTVYMPPEIRKKYDLSFEVADIEQKPLPKSDVVVCRNVAIYSERDPEALMSIFHNLEKSLNKNGVLVIDNKSKAMFEKIPELKQVFKERYGAPKVSKTGSVYRLK